ncbi:MAG: extracellular solute-binding protein [Limnochordaceae bacterium]|nr:extracellular solute-binding protein [Limnochordaceae bacterium]
MAVSVHAASDLVPIKNLSGDTVYVPKSDLGTIITDGKKPFAGKTITITVNVAGPKGPIEGPLHEWRKPWEELTGGKVNIVGIPYAEHYSKAMTDLLTGTGQYDIFMAGADWYGDLIAGNYIIPIDKYLNDPRFPKWDRSAMPLSQVALHTWQGHWYGVLNDSDGQVLYYRRDILTNASYRQRFKAKYGYDLPVPPKTWEQVRDIAEFFNGWDWNGDGEPDSGMVMHLKVGGQGMFHYASLSAPFVLFPGPTVDRYHNVYWFDPENMNPLINSPGHVRALELLLQLAKFGPSAQLSWDLGEAWDYFMRGKAVLTFSWGDVGGLVQEPGRSVIKGKLGTAMLPGTLEVWDREHNRWVKFDSPNVVGNTTGGSWHGVISALSKNPEVAYHFLAFLAMTPISQWHAYRGWDGVDPGTRHHFLAPQGDAKLEDYVAQGWNAEDVREYTQAYYETFFAERQLPYLRIPGGHEYWVSLDQHISEALTGAVSAKEALDRTARDWDEITNRLGRREQLELYRQSIGYGKPYQEAMGGK